MMKKIFKPLSLVALALLVITSCNQSESTPKLPGISKGLVDSASYAIGVSLGSMVQQADFGQINMKEVYKAIDHVLRGDSLRVPIELSNEVITKYMTLRQEGLVTINREAGTEFLEKNKEKEGVIELESGLQYKVITEGNDVYPAPQDTIEVHYKGMLIDGKEFDSSHSRGETATVVLNQFIPGWVEGLQKISEGGKIELFIPANLAYGDQNMGVIPPASTLVFEVELIKVSKVEEKEEK